MCMKKQIVSFIVFLVSFSLSAASPVILKVATSDGDATPILRQAIEAAATYKGCPVLIQLQQGDYHIYRTSSSPYLYYISNTASAEENPDPTKHIGI